MGVSGSSSFNSFLTLGEEAVLLRVTLLAAEDTARVDRDIEFGMGGR